MPIQIACPSCEQPLRVPENLFGQLVKCPKCDTTFTATADSSPPSERREEPSPPTKSVTSGSAQIRQPPSQQQSPEPESFPRPPQPEDDDFSEPRRSRRNYQPHRGTLILVLGILSVVGFGILTGIPAWIMGNSDLKQMRAGIMDPEGESNTNIGRILGMVMTIITLISFVPGCFCCFLGPMFNHR
jgi:hypothetical protein